MADMARRRRRKAYPQPPQSFRNLGEVAEWAGRLYRALAEPDEDSYGGNIVLSPNSPESTDGRDGDIWIQSD